jgi:hypothetical protein
MRKSVVPTYNQKFLFGLLMLLVANRTKLGRLLDSMRWYAASAASLKMSGWVDERACSTARFRTAGLIFNSQEAPAVKNLEMTRSTSRRSG